MRTPMPRLERIDVLRRYLRTLQADCDRVSRELNATYRKRRVCSFLESVASSAESRELCVDSNSSAASRMQPTPKCRSLARTISCMTLKKITGRDGGIRTQVRVLL